MGFPTAKIAVHCRETVVLLGSSLSFHANRSCRTTDMSFSIRCRSTSCRLHGGYLNMVSQTAAFGIGVCLPLTGLVPFAP